jgi:hypothetical protein
MQGLPPVLGLGEVHDLSRTLLPLPHEVEQFDHLLQSLKPPSTKKKLLFNERVFFSRHSEGSIN